MAANRKRIPFSAAGPFIARKGNPINGVTPEVNRVYDKSIFEGMHDRRLEQLFSAGFIDMAPADVDPAIITTAAMLDGPAHPLDHDGDGFKGGELSDEEKAALLASGYTVKQWMKLPEPERDTALALALLAAGAASGNDGDSGEAPTDNPEAGNGDEPKEAETPPAAPETGQGSDPAAETGETPPAAPAGPVAAYQHFGFGKYFAVNAAGERLGDKLIKSEAEGYAARDGVPLLGQAETLEG